MEEEPQGPSQPGPASAIRVLAARVKCLQSQ